MTRTRWIFAASLAAVVAFTAAPAAAAETCGDGVDNDSDGLTDEGCYPTGVTGVCESPLSCSRAGAAGPKTGALVFPVQPDVAPSVAYGPDVLFQRFYTSKYDPGYADLPNGAATDYRAPIGYRWQHNYMSWLELDTSPDPDEVVVHMVTGQDVLFTYDSGDATYDYFAPQSGVHVDYLRQHKSNGTWELRTLNGTVYAYDWSSPVGKLVKIKDGVGNYVELTYNGDGQVEWVKSASTAKKLKLEYQGSGSKLLQYVKYYTNTGSDTLRLTVEFTYSAGKLDLVKLDSTTVLDHGYDSDGYLTTIEDGEATPKTIASFAYLVENGQTQGKVVRIETPDGDVGYSYGATGCDSGNGTKVHFHRASTAECTVDADCGTGEYCGGQTDPSSNWTGTCFLAERCMVIDTTTEDLIDAVSATSCSSCVDTKDYSWDTTDIELDGRQSADSVWTSYLYNTDGRVTKMVEDDTDADASTAPAGARVTYYFYGDSSFPGRVTEIRRLSQLKPSGTCTDQTATDCKRTIYTYTTGGQVDTIQQKGFTYNNAGSVVAYDFTTDYAYDGYGRVTEIAGPRASTEDDVEYTYYGASNGLSTDRLKEVKRQKGASSYLTTTYAEYDFWGNAGRVTDPNSKSVCFEYHGDYNRMTTRRQVIDGSHTDCTSGGSNDETTSYSYDTYRRLTQIKKPLGNCIDYSHDGEGRIQQIAWFDKNGSSCESTGDSANYTYSDEGLVTKIEWKDASGSVTKRQQYTHYSDRRVEKLINPEATSYFKKWYYDDDGVPAKLEFEDFSQSAAKTEWDVDDLNRTTNIRRYTTSSSNEEWTLTQAAQHLGLPTEVADEASHDIDFVWDDLGRKVKQVTEESGTTLYVYDEASNVTEMVEADGAADEQTTTYTYDTLNRVTAIDTGDADCHTQGGAEIQYTYDALPGGASCPTGSSCDLLSGRLAHVKTVMWCDDAESDDTFDQATFYSYDEAGRIEQHTVQDDSGRKARVTYSHDDNSNITQIDYPSKNSAVYSYGNSHASNDDKIVLIKRDTTDILGGIKWLPAGPVDEYRQANGFWHNQPPFGYQLFAVRVAFSYNLAYRLTDIVAQSTYSVDPDPVLKVDHAEDVRGRYTQRDLSYGSRGGQRDSFYLYDDLSRVTCRRSSSGSTCPTSGSALGENLSYNASGDRSTLYLRNGVYTDQQFDVSYQSSTSDALDAYTYNGTSDKISFAFDTLGRRTSDDDSTFGGSPDKDKRTYTYDGRNNLVTVAGEYWTGSTWHTYTVSYAYDERNRMIFKSFVDEDDTCGGNPCEAQWFYYWDQLDRLIDAKYTPDITDSNTYSIFQWYWLDQRPFLSYQLDIATKTTTRRYLESDEQGRPLAAWSWPTSGDTTRVWEVDPGLFGWDEVTVGPNVYQPIRFPGQLYDEDTEAWADDSGATQKRPGISYNRYRSYDSFTGTYLQVDPKVDATWEPYTYVGQNPVMDKDELGLARNSGEGDGGGECWVCLAHLFCVSDAIGSTYCELEDDDGTNMCLEGDIDCVDDDQFPDPPAALTPPDVQVPRAPIGAGFNAQVGLGATDATWLQTPSTWPRAGVRAPARPRVHQQLTSPHVSE